MALRTRPTQFEQGASGVATEQITAASRLVSYLTGFAVQPNKAIVGGNAFAHESGIHQDGVIKNPLTYEIMTPQSVGLTGSQLTIGKLSGRRGLQGKMKELGYEIEGEPLDELYRQAVALADAKKEVTDADLMALMEQRAAEVPASVTLVGWSVTSSHGGNATGSISLTVDGQERSSEATGNGPVDALFDAVDQALQPVLGWHPTLAEYEIKAVSAGEDAQGQVLVRCRRSSDEGPGALIVSGHGLSTNIIEASLDAYLVAVNKLHGAEINGVAVAFVAPAVRGRPLPLDDDTYRIATIAGDGVGPEVIAAARRVVDAAGGAFGFDIDWSEFLVGGAAIDTYGVAIRPEDVTACGEADAILLGAVGGPKWSDPKAPVRPEQALFALRGGLGLYANLRPISIHPALSAASPLRPELLAGVDMMIVRELTGGIYFGERRETSGAAGARSALDTLPYSEAEVGRIVRLAFELARNRRKHVTSVDKANVLATSRLWRTVTEEVARDYPDVTVVHQLVDSCAMLLVRRPADFDVIVTENLFGDILSDEAAVLAGSLGMLPSASLGERRTAHGTFGLYEPIHGSAPDIAGQDLANPIGTILSAAMLLRMSLGREDAAAAIESAVSRALDEGWRTGDLADRNDPEDGLVVVGTTAFATGVIESLAERAEVPA